jgi:hypothetical protein
LSNKGCSLYSIYFISASFFSCLFSAFLPQIYTRDVHLSFSFNYCPSFIFL